MDKYKDIVNVTFAVLFVIATTAIGIEQMFDILMSEFKVIFKFIYNAIAQ